MPRDNSGGAFAPRPLSAFLLRERRLKLLRKIAKRHAFHRRRVTALHLAEAEAILRSIVEGGDLLTEVDILHGSYGGPFDPPREAGVALMITMTAFEFRRLCRYGAELEDDEDTGDDEPSWGGSADPDTEVSLGSSDADLDQTRWVEGCWSDCEGPEADHEPSLGSCDGIVDQTRWTAGHEHGDNESEKLHGGDPDDTCDAEENGDRDRVVRAPR